VLRLFRINDPYRLLGVFLVMLAFAMPLLVNSTPLIVSQLKNFVVGEALNDGKAMYTQVIDDTPWLAAKMDGWMVWIFGRSIVARQILTLTILYVQACFFAIILVDRKAFSENNYFTGLIFGILCFFSFDMLSLSNELWASLFLLLAINNLFKEIEFKTQRDGTIFNLGLYLGIASMFVFSYGFFLIGSLIILLVFARLQMRKSLLLFFGFAFPHLLLIALYFFRGELNSLTHLFYDANFSVHTKALVSLKSMLWLGGAIIIYFIFSLFMLGREARFTRYQSQLVQVMFLWLLVAVVEIIFTHQRTPHSFITFIPPLAYFISHYLLLIRRKWIGELMLWILILSVATIGHLSKENKLQNIDYSNLFVKNAKRNFEVADKRILILGDDFGLYEKNKAASYFLNWNYSKEIFELNHYYSDLVLINNSFQTDPPDVIVDEKNVMKKIMNRIPSLEKQYEKKGVLYERRFRPDSYRDQPDKSDNVKK